MAKEKFDYKPFIAEVRKQMELQDVKYYADLAELTGYKMKTISAFMNSKRNSLKTAIAIKKALKIKRKYGFEKEVKK